MILYTVRHTKGASTARGWEALKRHTADQWGFSNPNTLQSRIHMVARCYWECHAVSSAEPVEGVSKGNKEGYM